MNFNRRNFFKTAGAGSLGAGLLMQGCHPASESASRTDYNPLDVELSRPVLKKELFPDPVLIDRLELLRYKNNFICRVTSKDGAEGLSVANNAQMISLYPIFVQQVTTLFPGKGCAELGKLAGRGLCLQEQLQSAEPGTLGTPGHHRICRTGYAGKDCRKVHG